MTSWSVSRSGRRRVAVIGAAALAAAVWAGGIAQATSGPAARWSFDELSGATVTDSVGAVDGTLEGASRISAGVAGRALHFDGDDVARIPTDPVIESATVAIRLWVRGNPLSPPADGQVILADGARDCDLGAWALVVDRGHVALQYRELQAPGGIKTVTLDERDGFPSLWDGSWHLVAFESFADTYGWTALYQQGWIIGPASEHHAIDRSDLDVSDLTFGGPAAACAGSGFVGDIDEVRIDDTVIHRDLFAADEPVVATSVAIESVEAPAVDQTTTIGVRILPLPLAPGSIRAFLTGEDGIERPVGVRSLDWWNLSADGRYTLSMKPADGGTATLRVRFDASLPQSPSETTSVISVAKAPAYPYLGLQNTYIEHEPIDVGIVVSSGAYVFPNGTVELWEQTSAGPVLLASKAVVASSTGFLSAANFQLAPRPAGPIELFPRYRGGTAHAAADGIHGTLMVEPALVTGIVRINGGAASTSDPIVQVETPAVGAVAIQIARRLDDLRFMDPPIPYVASLTTWLTMPGYGDDQDGVRTIYVRWADAMNRWSDWSSDTIVLDRGLTSGSVSVDDGAAVTTSHAVTVGVPVHDPSSVAAVQLSNDGTTWSVAKPYAATVPWILAAGDGTRTVRVRWLDADGRQSVSKSDSITVDATGPVIGTVRSRSAIAGRPATSIPVRFSWSATDTSRIRSYDVQLRTGAGAWKTIATGITTAGVSRSLIPSTLYGLRVRGRDVHGNVGAWSAESRVRPAAIQNSSSRVSWTGPWSTVHATAYWGGSSRWSGRAGATAALTFRGTGIAWVAPVGPTRGRASVSVDGVVVGTINLYSATPGSARIVFERSWTTIGTHVIRIRVAGTSGHSRIDMDGLIVLSSV